ncbi:hypothetical protein JIG36_27245 [Actinoplanes sp. LDG1-06]|uniref:Uncharacterized protein n=1 Tax=Paractinoplanes ovalisporus TaxID=2810368 RepID=A0ABS2AIQ5_9ACTN|nr:hypothetical protein [Actinoplanes ovalisporus]MBM2619253.1 hypothetical protein [Actinoplanes ovalisporus]
MKPHRMDGVSLSFGVLFLLVAIWWAVSRVVTIHLPAVGWLVAGGLILFGVIGLLGALRSARSAAVTEQKPAPAVAPQPEGPELPGDLTPEVHASIVRELMDETVDRITKENPELKPEQPRRE